MVPLIPSLCLVSRIFMMERLTVSPAQSDVLWRHKRQLQSRARLIVWLINRKETSADSIFHPIRTGSGSDRSYTERGGKSWEMTSLLGRGKEKKETTERGRLCRAIGFTPKGTLHLYISSSSSSRTRWRQNNKLPRQRHIKSHISHKTALWLFHIVFGCSRWLGIGVCHYGSRSRF